MRRDSMKRFLSVFFMCVIVFAGFSQKRKLNLEFLDSELVEKGPSYVHTGNDPNVVAQEWHTSYLDFVKYSSDGKYLMTASNEIKIWDAETGLLIRTVVSIRPYLVVDKIVKKYSWFSNPNVETPPPELVRIMGVDTENLKKLKAALMPDLIRADLATV